jgi:hypothetical protein
MNRRMNGPGQLWAKTPDLISKTNQSKKGWRHGSSDRALA